MIFHNIFTTAAHLLFLSERIIQQTCSQVLTVQVQVQVLASQVQVLNLRVQVQVRDSMSQPVFLVISKNFQL